MAKELFLSYGREPEIALFVKQLKCDLQANGFSVWLDTEDITAGCDWHAAIGTGLDMCKALIAVISNKYINSRYCKSELYTANGDQKHIFPVIVENVDFSSTERARGVKYVVSGINWTMFRLGYDDYQTSLTKLITGMKEHGLGPVREGTGVDDALLNKMSQLQVNPSAPPRPSSPSPNPGFPAPYPLPPSPANPGYMQTTPSTPSYPPSPANPGYTQTTPTGYTTSYPPSPANPGYVQTTPPAPPYTTPPHPVQYPYPGYSPSPHGHPYPGGYYTSPPGGYVPPMQYPPGQYYTHPTSGYPGYPPQPPPNTVGVSPGNFQESPPQYRQLFPPGESIDGGEAESIPNKTRENFKVGMKLECVDRRFPYFVCVATVMDRNDDELMVHFDGWGPEYNYWCSRDSVELHPSEWCQKHSWDLQKPLNQDWDGWSSYLTETQSEAAGDDLFSEGQLAGPESLLFSPGMRVEAKDTTKPSVMCVATIKEVSRRKVLVHYDGWGEEWNFWCDAGSTDIHPPMWSGRNGKTVTPPLGYRSSDQFKWSVYLANEMVKPAPAHLFKEEQISADGRRTSVKPSVGAALDGFQIGMKLEAKDRLHPTVICVATIKSIKDGQLLIKFDGWTSKYDYWCKPTSNDIHPSGWCQANGRQVNPPNGYMESFDWSRYLKSQSATAAPDNLFTQDQRAVSTPPPQVSPSSQFKPGMKLEAKDRKNPTIVCVATITEVSNGKLLIHFDGWTNTYDYWCAPSTPDIHPIGWCQAQGHHLQPPHHHSGSFDWTDYLSSTASIAAPSHLFSEVHNPVAKSPQSSVVSNQFKPGMKLEAKDRKNPTMVCVATISEVRNGQLLIHFDGWSSKYDYWCGPTTPDIHPIGWCASHQYHLQTPNGYHRSFSWDTYLNECWQESGSVAAPKTAFTSKQC